MSRSGYGDDYDSWDTIRWRGAVKSAIRGKRGQAFLHEMLAALDALPEKRLITDELENATGEVCAIGAVGRARGVLMDGLDPEDREVVAATFGIAEAMAAEIVYENDEFRRPETPEQRWQRMRNWIESCITDARARGSAAGTTGREGES